MTKYIDADLFFEVLANGHSDGSITGPEDVEKLVKEFTAADVKEVAHGKWMHIGENSTGNIFMCSACDHCVNPNKKDVKSGRADEKTNFCPHCGADMRGVE